MPLYVTERNPKRNNKIAILGNSIVNQIPFRAGSYTAWSKTTGKSLNNTVSPVHQDIKNGSWASLYYTCIQSGITGSIEPMWPTTIGEQITDGTVIWEATNYQGESGSFVSYFGIAQALSGQRLQEVYICGKSGEKSTYILQHLQYALDCDADIIYFANMFENDVWQGGAPILEDIYLAWDNLVKKINYLIDLGKIIMINTVFPSGNIDSTSVFTGYSLGNGTKAYHWLNAKIKEYANKYRNNIILCDLHNTYIESNPVYPVYPENTITYLSATGSGQQLKKTDGVHPYVAANYIVGKKLANIISNNFPAVDRFSSALNVYSLSKNPLNYGTAGTAGTGITSGTPADLMTAIAYGTIISSVLSKIPRTDINGEFQQQTYSASSGDNANYNNTSIFPLVDPFIIGNCIQAFSEIKILANPTLCKGPSLELSMNSATNRFHKSFSLISTDQDFGQFLTEDTLFTLKTPPVAIMPGTTSLSLSSRVYGRSICNFTAQFGRSAINITNIPNIS